MESADTVSSGRRSSGARPARLRALDELGRARTLGPGPFVPCFDRAGDGPLVFLGLGPDPAGAAARVAAEQAAPGEPVYWLECPDFARQMPATWAEAIPPSWVRLTPDQLKTPPLATSANLFRYAPAEGLFSSFWGPLLAFLEAARLFPGDGGSVGGPVIRRADGDGRSRMVLLPGTDRELLTAELEAAFRAEGFAPVRVASPGRSRPEYSRPEHPQASPAISPPLSKELSPGSVSAAPPLQLEEILRNERPALFLSVNLRGLDPEGRRFRLLRACGVPVAVWCVDNPWHLLSALRLPWWKEAALFVTDASFVAPLREHGALFVRHLPLGAWEPATPGRSAPASLKPVVFVGRSAFPDRDRFFAGCRLPQSLRDQAFSRLDSPDPAALPHVHWWERALEVDCCWPGSAVRAAGLGAEQGAALRRALWLRASLPLGLTVFGDEGWKPLLPEDSDLRPPLDYYNGLFDVYAHARYSLNVTSLLLPAGLTQRHFDVWMAGGFLLSDATPGLEIFPEELARPIRVTHPARLCAHVEGLEKDPLLRPHLAEAWRACLRREHGYGARVRSLLAALNRMKNLSY